MIPLVVLLSLAAGLAAAATPDDFFAAIRAGDDVTLRKLAADKSAVSVADSRGTTPLHYAAAFGNVESVKLLLDAGAHVNAKNTFDATPLILAASSPAKVKLLLAAGADVKAKTKGGRTALLIAAGRSGAVSAVRALLDAGSDVNDSDMQGMTPLMTASFEGELETMKLLVARGANVHAVDKTGSTALQYSTAWMNAEGAKLLLAKGADVNAANHSSGKVRHGDIALNKLTPLILAAPYGSEYYVKSLLDAGAKVNTHDGRGLTPLMAAVSSENYDVNVIGTLLKAGADVNAKDTHGATALDWARRTGNPVTIGLLEKAGARGSTEAPGPQRKAPPLAAREAVELSLGLLAKSSAEFFNQSGCTGCHHQPGAAIAWKAARAAGVDAPAIRDVIVRSAAAARPVEPALLQFFDIGGEVDTAANVAAAMFNAGLPANSLTDAIVNYIAGKQHFDGSWKPTSISRPPSEESNVSRAAVSVYAIRNYGWPARQDEWDERVARTRRWMLKVEPRSTYERAELLLGLHWAGGRFADVDRIAAGLRAEQRDDGGWAQNRYLKSDAYTTGLALHALAETGRMKPSDAAYSKGVQFLLKTQLEDGSWFVRSRAPKFQPYFESGFPHGHDQWISALATSYAVAAIAPTLK